MPLNGTSHWGTEPVDPNELSLPALKVRFLLEHLPAAGSVLEIGCGGGKILRTIALQRPELELHGCDVRDPEEVPKAYAFRRILRGLPYADHSFDCTLLVDVLEHVPDPRQQLREAARVTRPGGRFVAFVPIEGEPLSFYELFRRLLGSDTYRVTKEHVHAFKHKEARLLIEERFDIISIRYAYHALGQLFDAAFFAAARAKPLRELWWACNVFYNPKMRDSSGPARVMNGLLVAANAIAAVESTILSHEPFASAGILVDAVARKRGPDQAAVTTDAAKAAATTPGPQKTSTNLR